jgi:hypothetical protein
LFSWLSRVCASIAVQMQSLAVGWQIYNLTNSPCDLGLAGIKSIDGISAPSSQPECEP